MRKLLLLICLVGCGRLGRLQPEPYLPPPPRALTPISSLFKSDTTAAIMAESLLIERTAMIRRARIADSLSIIACGARCPKGPDGEKGSQPDFKKIFPDRFGDGVIQAGGVEDAGIREERLIKEREMARSKGVEWMGAGDTDYTMLLNQSWGQLRAVMRSGDEVTIRASVWPATVLVVPGTARMIRLESGWISLARISPRELKCQDGGVSSASASISTVASGPPAVRMVAFIEKAEARNKSAVTASSEFRGVDNCMASAIWRDRVADFAFDSWLGGDRAAKLGGPPLISR